MVLVAAGVVVVIVSSLIPISALRKELGFWMSLSEKT